MPTIFYLTLLRLIVPLTILRWPLIGTLLSSILDLNDWKLSGLEFQNGYAFYQNWDKAMDLYYMTIALFVSFKWKDKIAKNLTAFLFMYRFLGDVIFWITQSHIFLFIFPNFFENFFVFYLLFTTIYKKTKLFTTNEVWPVLIIFLGIPKIIQEYFLHVLQKQAWQYFPKIIYDLKNENLNFFIQALIFYVLPFSLGLYFARRIQKNS